MLVPSNFKSWLVRYARRRRLVDELADLSPEQVRDAGLDLRGVALPRRAEPDDLMLQRVGWRADRREAHAEPCGNGLQMSLPRFPSSLGGTYTPLRFANAAGSIALAASLGSIF